MDQNPIIRTTNNLITRAENRSIQYKKSKQQNNTKNKTNSQNSNCCYTFVFTGHFSNQV